MQLVVSNKEVYNTHFIYWLLRKIKRVLTSYLSSHTFSQYTEPLHQSYGVDVNVKQLLYLGVLSLKVTTAPSSFTIQIDHSKKIQRCHLAALCRFVNYGGNGVKGYPLFTTVFDHFNAHLSEYYEAYLREHY